MTIPGLRGVSPWAVANRAARDFVADDMPTYATALAFRALLALVPFAIFLLALLGSLGLAGFFDWLVRQAQTALPRDAASLVRQAVAEVRGQASGGLLTFGILVAVWAASAAVRALMTALNAAHGVAESRPLWKRYPLSVAYTLGLTAMLIAAAGLMLVGPQVVGRAAGWANLGGPAVALWDWMRWPAGLFLLLTAVAVAYHVAPDVDRPFRLATPGSVLAVAAWIAASLGFAAYAGRFGSFGATYGSLAGAVVLLLYLFLSAAALLLGAEVDAAIDRLAGTGQPDGRRGRRGAVCPFP
jgi:membrane protein